MKGSILLVIFAIILAFGSAQSLLQIHLGARQQLWDGSLAYALSCTGATGQVKYQAKGLPANAIFESGRFIFPTNGRISVGVYLIKVTATDALGYQGSEFLFLTVQENNKIDLIAGSASSQTNAQTSQTSTSNTQSNNQIIINNVSGSPQNDEKLSQILNTYSTTSSYNINYDSNVYPTPQLPTGSGQFINTQTITINNAQTNPSTANRNTISADSVLLKAASERYQTAIKAVTNILTIIDEARANKAKAQMDLTTYSVRYNDAVKYQRNAQENIINIEIKVTQINSAIKGVQNKLNETKAKILEIQNSINNLNNRKNQLSAQIQIDGATRGSLLTKLSQVNNQLVSLVEQLRTAKDSCDQVRINLEKTKTELQKKRTDYSTLQQRQKLAQLDFIKKQAEVKRLTSLLESAKNAEADARIVIQNLNNEATVLPKAIADLEIQVKRLQADYEGCQNDVQNLERKIKDLQTGEIVQLQAQIDVLSEKIRINTNGIRSVDGQITTSKSALETLISQKNQNEDNLNYLKTQFTSIQNTLRNAYTAGNDANTQVAIAKQNLEAVNSRWERESLIESEASLNLDRARAEVQLAKLALDELIASYSNALPYSIVPNGNGVGAGTPYGNNPAGAALGPATQSASRIQISNWTNYLSSAFGRGINPAYDGNVNYLYKFQPTIQTGTFTTNVCNTSGGSIRSVEGTLVQNLNNSMVINSNGQYMRLNYGTCTNFSSNQPNYQLQRGDYVIAKGRVANGQLACSDAIVLVQ